LNLVTSGTGRGLYDNTDFELEVDPHKMEEANVGNLIVNKYTLLLTTQKLYQNIVESSEFVPREIKSLLYEVSSAVSQKYHDYKYKSVGAFFFLRFVVPSITTPHIYGLLEIPPDEMSQRNLILLAKVLQNLANEVQFGSKEDYMTKLNDFISENINSLHIFLDSIAGSRETIGNFTVPENVKSNALCCLHSYIHNNLNKILSCLESRNPEMTQKLKNTISDLGDPNHLIKN
jgi:neurofibromin 1